MSPSIFRLNRGSARSFVFYAVLSLCTSAGAATSAASPTILRLQTHAAFVSSELHLRTPLDPQVFVADGTAPAGIGPQQIFHAAGLRNPRIAESAGLPIMNSQGKRLNMSLGQWLSATGEVLLIVQPNGQERVTAILRGLKPGGHYSLFENHFDQDPIGFTPLDGKGADNDFVADVQGSAVFTTTAPIPLTHDNAILVVYHSDDLSHGRSRGHPGLDAHHQLIVRPGREAGAVDFP